MRCKRGLCCHAVSVCLSVRPSVTFVDLQNGGLEGFEGEDVKILCSNPQKALPCVNTHMLVYSMSKSVQRPNSRCVKSFCVQRNIKNWVVTLAIWGEVTPCSILTKCGLWGDMVDIIMCAIFGDCRLRGVGVVRGVSLPSPIDLTCRSYNTGHFTVWPCDITTNSVKCRCGKTSSLRARDHWVLVNKSRRYQLLWLAEFMMMMCDGGRC